MAYADTLMRVLVRGGSVGLARASFAFLLLVLPGCAAHGPAQWTQWGGPHRNFMVDSEGLADSWPEEGPRQLWSRELGDGYSTVMVDGGTLYTMYRPGAEEREFVIALNAQTGETIWEFEHESLIIKRMKQFGPGPSSSLLVTKDRVFSIGANAALHCLDKATGKVVWMHDLPTEFEAKIPGRGYSASAVAYKHTIIVPVGGKDGQTLVAFDQSDGSVVWKGLDFSPTHSSPAIIEFAGKPQIVFAASKALIGVNPDDGALLWEVPLKKEGAYLSSPLWTGDDFIFISSAYGGGSHGVRLREEDGKTVAEEVWYDRKMRIHHQSAVRIGEFVYGSSGDFGPAFLAGINIDTGKVAWRERGFSKANLLWADGKVIVLDEDGNLALTRMTPEGVEVLSKIKVAERYAWAAPTLVGKTLYIRDRKHIMAFDLG